MKYLLTIIAISIFHSIALSQNFKENGIDSSRHTVIVFKTIAHGIVITPELIISAKDYNSFRILTQEEFNKDYKGFPTLAAIFIDVKPETKILKLNDLLAHFKINADLSKYRIQVNVGKPDHKKNIYGAIQSIKSIEIDKAQAIIHIYSYTP